MDTEKPPEPTPELDSNLNSFFWLRQPGEMIDKCYEFLYRHKNPCPEGYVLVIVNTPTSDQKDWCKESFGAIIECGKVVE